MVTREVLAKKVWKAFDVMRRDDGTTGLVEYVEQSSWMIFLKVFDDLETRFKAESELAGKKYERIIDGKYRWQSWATKDWKAEELVPFIDGELIPHLRSISGSAERQMIGTIFAEIRNRMRSPYNLKDVIVIFSQIDYNNSDDSHILSQIYEDTLLKLGREGGLAGEFYTPRPIVRLMVKIVSPTIGESVLDPFCGSGGFLVESYKHMLESKEIGVRDYDFLQHKALHGQEKKSFPYLLGVMNCILHGMLAPDIRRTNTLSENIRNIPEQGRHHAILTNPPFGGEENEQVQQNFPIQIQATELLALQYVMKKLRTNGRCGIVVPEGVLSGTGAYSKVKEELLKEYNLHTIVSLPSGVFANVTASGQGPKTDLVFFDKTGPTKEIWYYELSPPSGRNYSRANPVKDTDLQDCYEKWRERRVSENSWRASLRDIINLGYDLTAKNPNRGKILETESPHHIITSILNNERRIEEILQSIEASSSQSDQQD